MHISNAHAIRIPGEKRLRQRRAGAPLLIYRTARCLKLQLFD